MVVLLDPSVEAREHDAGCAGSEFALDEVSTSSAVCAEFGIAAREVVGFDELLRADVAFSDLGAEMCDLLVRGSKLRAERLVESLEGCDRDFHGCLRLAARKCAVAWG
jgi:hypothetical protein